MVETEPKTYVRTSDNTKIEKIPKAFTKLMFHVLRLQCM